MKRLYVFSFLVFLSLIGGFLWWKNGTSAVNPNDKTTNIFVVEKGAGVRAIANKLKAENLIKSPVVFFLLVKKESLDSKIQAGDFRLSKSMPALEIAQNLTHGTLDIWVTIPEGKRAEEIADILQKLLPTYQDNWRDILVKNEGYLFPDTYLFPKDADIALIISSMKNNFEKQFNPLGVAAKNREKVVIIASLIEREAKHPEDRPLVASVIYNRLDINMALQIDATVQYTTSNIKCKMSQNKCNWWPKNLTKDDLAFASTYNTYKQPGLPPGPIANPGFASLQAAANPAKTNYLYYIADKNGINRYGTTLEEHEENIQKYGLR